MLKPGDKALCRDSALDPDLWHPESPKDYWGKPTDARRAAVLKGVEAIEICSQCELAQKCLEYSFQSYDTQWNGIFGGVLPDERAMMIKPNATSSRADIPYGLFAEIRRVATERGIPAPILTQRKEGQWQPVREAVVRSVRSGSQQA